MRVFLLSIFILISSIGLTQNNEDFGVWLGSDFSKKINKKIDGTGSLSLRTEENSTQVRQIFYQVGVKIELLDELKTAISFRNNLNFDFSGNESGKRILWDLSYKLKAESFAVQIRNRFQVKSKDKTGSEVLDRIRLKGDVDLQDGLKGYIFNEFFFELTNSYQNNFAMNRFGFGMEYKINKDLSVSLGYFRQASQGYRTPKIFNGINLEFEIDL